MYYGSQIKPGVFYGQHPSYPIHLANSYPLNPLEHVSNLSQSGENRYLNSAQNLSHYYNDSTNPYYSQPQYPQNFSGPSSTANKAPQSAQNPPYSGKSTG